jgi:hypothetical protein
MDFGSSWRTEGTISLATARTVPRGPKGLRRRGEQDFDAGQGGIRGEEEEDGR